MTKPSFAIANFYTRGYNYYFRPFYDSAKRHFFPNNPKTFFIFTDNPYIDEPDIVRIPIEDGQPRMQHWHLRKILDRLAEYDHFVLFNGNAFFLQTIDLGEHPEDETFLAPLAGSTTGLSNPPYSHVCSDPASVAYLDRDADDISIYWRGCLWGGQKSYVIPMIECLAERCQIGAPRDEHLINWYLVKHRNLVSCLCPKYVWSGMWGNNPYFDIRIVMADKLGAYPVLKNQQLPDERLRAYAKLKNPDGPFYLGPGNWRSDILEVGNRPPDWLTKPPKGPTTRRLKRLTHSILSEVLPPFLFKAVRYIRHGYTTLPK
jgi:hypothetical protein